MAPPSCPSAGGGGVSTRVLYRPEPALSVAVDLKVPRARGGTPKQLGASLTLSAHRVLHHLFSWPDWLWSPSGSQPPDWRPPHGSYRTPGAGQTPARPPAALLAAWCRRPPLAPPPPPRLPAARVSGVPLSRCTAVLLQGGPGLGPTAFFSRDCSHFGQSLPVLQHRQVPKAGGDSQGSGMLKARSPRCRAQPARRLRVAQILRGTRTTRFQLAAEPEPGDLHPRTLWPRGAKYRVSREPRRPASERAAYTVLKALIERGEG